MEPALGAATAIGPAYRVDRSSSRRRRERRNGRSFEQELTEDAESQGEEEARESGKAKLPPAPPAPTLRPLGWTRRLNSDGRKEVDYVA